MRPILKLKKSLVEAAAVAEVAVAVEASMGPVSAEVFKRPIEVVQAVLTSYLGGLAVFNQLVLVDGVECLRPLAIGADKEVLAWVFKQPEIEGCSKKTLRQLVNKNLKAHVSKEKYHIGVLKFDVRFGFSSQAKGDVLYAHKTYAAKRVGWIPFI